jgi:hypothetical protein
MKTAMQELIEDIKRVIPAFKLEIYEQNFNAYLEKEKEQIIDAYNQGALDGESSQINYPNYYNQTYNNGI